MHIKNEKLKLLLIMGISYALYIIGIVGSMPLHTSTDELGAIVGAATLAGRDWSGVIENSGYYGFGYYTFFFWLFKVTNSPDTIYRIIICSTAFLRVLIIPIAYYIAKNYLGIRNEKILIFSSMLMSWMYSSSIGTISNEYILELLSWLIILLICKVIECQNYKLKREILSFALIFVCFYSLLIHTRALTLIIAILVTLLGYSVYKRKLNMFAFIAVGIGLVYIVANKIINLYQNDIYGITGQTLRNSTVEVASNVKLFDLEVWSVWFHMLLGLLNTEILVTGGFFLVSIVAFIMYIINLYKKRYMYNNEYCNIILSISVLCMGAVICAFLLSNWFTGILECWNQEGENNSYAYKGLTYIRYWNVFLPPFILCSISILEHLNFNKIINIAATLYSVIQFAYIGMIIPIIQRNVSAASPFFGLTGYSFGDEITRDTYFYAMIISIMMFICIFILERTKYKQYIWLLLVVFMLFQQENKIFNYDLDVKKRISEMVDASYEMKCSLENKNIVINNIYAYDTSGQKDNNWKIYSIVQFYFNEYTIRMNLPDEIKVADIIIATEEVQEIEQKYKDIKCYVLDNNEVWYTYLDL